MAPFSRAVAVGLALLLPLALVSGQSTKRRSDGARGYSGPKIVRKPNAGGGGGSSSGPQPLDSVLMQVFDKDKDGQATLAEVTQMMSMLQGMMGEASEENDTANMVKAAASLAPSLFTFLDGDGDGQLAAAEMAWVAKAQAGFKEGGANREVVRGVFAALDANGDGKVDAAEVTSATTDPDGSVLGAVAAAVHSAYPVRKDAQDLRALLSKGLTSFLSTADGKGAAAKGIASGIGYLDTDGDGAVDKKEAGGAYNKAKQAFLKAASQVQEMGPMLAMFGGGMGGGMGGDMGGMGGGNMPRAQRRSEF